MQAIKLKACTEVVKVFWWQREEKFGLITEIIEGISSIGVGQQFDNWKFNIGSKGNAKKLKVWSKFWKPLKSTT